MPADDRQATACRYLAADLDDALTGIANARKLLPHAGLPDRSANRLLAALDRAEAALTTACEETPDA